VNVVPPAYNGTANVPQLYVATENTLLGTDVQIIISTKVQGNGTRTNLPFFPNITSSSVFEAFDPRNSPCTAVNVDDDLARLLGTSSVNLAGEFLLVFFTRVFLQRNSKRAPPKQHLMRNSWNVRPPPPGMSAWDLRRPCKAVHGGVLQCKISLAKVTL